MEYKKQVELVKETLDYFSQSEAAALAVLVSAIRVRMEEDSKPVKDEEMNSYNEIRDFLRLLEVTAMESINKNDGNVTHWIGIAAKQLNPLLT